MVEQEKYITPTDWSKRKLLERMFRMVPLPGGAYCCEVGCGAGIFLSYLDKNGFRALGIDLSNEAVDIANKRLRSGRVTAAVKTIFDLNEKFDVVFVFEVLEHIEEDQLFLSHISKKILKEEGLLFISVPARQMLYSKGDRYYGHLRRYEKKDLVAKLKKAGMRTLLFWSYGLIPMNLICHHLLFRKHYSSQNKDMDMETRTMDSGILKFPAIWKIMQPFAVRFYNILMFVERAFLNWDIGYAYLVCSRKEKE